ncbi:Uncharacterized conserved protein, DUF1015 family [Catalinimonas alkaloidigena]|uniref:Uncharacterized conserved protein, DUF1015 family n=1 Tax=Catalinimonas alkaloidigena TaxID=1075417 RepID=A0A1G9RDF9_9BACT|nr:DUF1015 domain-containing protein [Catalinimonas alkaloidigena]SDM21254.1 Uncharacterized conserved protein, DUF1015 family [Catalinimonas alkaloidigena]
MAKILPLRAWRYRSELIPRLESLTSPLFDVVSEKQRQRLYQEPYNSIHLSVPRGEHPHQQAAQTLATWQQEGVLQLDPLPALYVYYQHFSLPGSDQQYVRKGFIGNLRLYDWDENVVLRHENTIPGAVDDRVALLEHLQMHVSPTHGLYTDPTFELERYMDESMAAPLLDTEDYQGVRDVLSVIHDLRIIRRFQEVLRDKPVILADGHHRYEGSLAYRHHQRHVLGHDDPEAPWNYHLMYLTNTENGGLRILPAHRLLVDLPDFAPEALLARLQPYFTMREVANPYDLNEIIVGKPWTFGLILRDQAYKIQLKPDQLDRLAWKFPEEIRRLDLTVLHYFAIEKGLGIPGKEQRRSPHIRFERNFAECVSQVAQGTAQLALITNEVPMQDIKRVTGSGYTLPQKSTYFYPKVICGFVFSSLKKNEFTTEDHSCFPVAAPPTTAR